MNIGDRLRTLREEKKFTQGEVEKRTGVLRTYLSRVENGHTVPSVETLEKFARALEVPMYQLFYDGEEPAKLPNLPKRKSTDDSVWGNSGKDARLLAKFCRLFSRTNKSDLKLLFFWPKRWRGLKSFNLNCLEVGHSGMRGSSIFRLICSEALSDLPQRLRTIMERKPEVVRPLPLRLALNRSVSKNL